MANPETAVTVIEQSADAGVVEWNLDAFPEDRFNRLVPVQTLVSYDLLRPVVQIVKLNPDPKNGGDVYTSGDTPSGHAAPTKVGLRKLATAAGISFIDERRTDDGTNPDVIEVSTVAEMLMPTGQRIQAVGTKRVDLNAQSWASPAQRAKYKSFFQEHVASRAQNRAIRALLSLRGSYPIETYQRPFAVVSFAPNMNHPEVRSRMLDAMAGASAQLYGPAAARQLEAGKPINVTPAPDEDPAPPPPTPLPGERLAAAAQTGSDVPEWAQGVAPAAAAPKPGRRTAPTLVQRLQELATACEVDEPMNAEQAATLTRLIGKESPLDWSIDVLPVLRAAFGETFAPAQMAYREARSIEVLAFSFDSAEPPVDFALEWRQAAEAARKQVAS